MNVVQDLLAVQTSDVIRVIDLLGVFSNGLLGGAMARAARLDPVGFIVLAILSGMGGGILRDMMLQRGTVVALTDPWYLIIALIAAGLAFIVKTDGPMWDKLFPWIDALALGTWSATGSLKALTFGLDWIPAVLLGTITAVGGGFLRDVILNRIPTVLGGNTLYATAGAFGATVMVVMYELGLWTVGPLIAMLAAGGLCLIARWRNWMLPVSYDWGGLRYETERYTQAIIRRGRRLRDVASKATIVIRPTRQQTAPAQELPETSEHSHRARNNRRIRPGQGLRLDGVARTGGHRVVPARDSGTTGGLPRIMRGPRRQPSGDDTPPAPPL